ncbi:right-handed parallel beta-helix repeat-containing protein [Methylomonas sp. OY6]|uniref:Right-handed parallel beta-helix repeat-containing protein n=1 Tax=Methylomonas defluvii TaxID=3045149 RepID=A0ABU4UCS1_9GAMM|nr:right-handed parallel beta-helix repeat-containing protein [Methylomonas sp. OY6]MDX8127155.1 right-handed parallel beta-helix repeat-containing protein [Methylomonas sp. OY6]
MRKCKPPFISIIALFCISNAANSYDIYVAISGNDQANGLTVTANELGSAGPFRTIARAQQAIRDLKKNSLFNETITVHIQPGTYTLPQPLSFDIRDSGFHDREIHWIGENGSVIISGGLALKNCTKGDDKVWNCPTAGLNLDKIKYLQNYRKQGSIVGFELFVNQKPMHIARWPNTDWAHIKVPLNKNTSFSSLEKIPPLANDITDAQVHIMPGNDWFDQYIAISEAHENQINLKSQTNYPLESGRRFYLQNILSELDAPGEWFYNKLIDNISFIPPNTYEPFQIEVSTIRNLLVINSANYISFNNITFSNSTDIAININKANHLTFDNIVINNAAGRGIESNNSNNIIISNSHIYDTGEGAILLEGGDRKTLESSNNIVHNNYIHDFGRIIFTYTPGIEASGVGTRITHNLVEHGPGTGILIGGNDHFLEKNEVHHVCEQASDCGAIYSGRDWTYRGNIIRNNSIHDIFGYGLKSVDISKDSVVYGSPDGARGIYLDDAVSGFNITGNIFNNAGFAAILVGGGRDNIIENNFIITDSYGLWIDNRWPNYNWNENRKRLSEVPFKNQTWSKKYPKLGATMQNETWPEGNILRRNVVISTKNLRPALHYLLPKQTNSLANNLVWSTSSQLTIDYNILDSVAKRNGASWQEWMAEGLENGSINADPCYKITGNSITFCPESPISKIGFEAISNDIGLIKQ